MPLLPWGNGHHRASTLTKLPPKLKHKRSASLASHRSTTQLSPASPPSPCESHFTISRPGSLSISETEEAEHGHRLNSEFKSLLRAAPGEADVRQSVRLSLAEWGVQGAGDGDDLAPRRPSLANCRRETGNHSHEEESLLVLPGEEMGVTGRDAVQVLQELHRIRVARSRQVHRRLALWDETVTLVVLLASFWVLVEAIAVLSQGGGQGSLGKIRFVQMGLMLLAVGVCIATVLWLKTLRPSRLSVPTLIFALVCASTHVSLAFTNCVLVGVYKSSRLASVCDWSIDVAWKLGSHSCDNPSNHFKEYAAAAAVRFVITLAVAGVWLASLRTFWRSLSVVAIVDPAADPGVEVREMLAHHSATVVPLIERAYTATDGGDPPGGRGREHLPHMPPDRRTGQVSEATQASFESSKTVRILGWLGKALEWLVGPIFGTGDRDGDGDGTWRGWEEYARAPADEGEYNGEKALGPTPVARDAPDRRRMSAAVCRPSIVLYDREDSSSSSTSHRPPWHADPARYKDLFTGQQGGSAAATPAGPENGTGNEPSQGEPPLISWHGGLVYVRMLDGRLVRKLSTIASASEPATVMLGSESGAGGTAVSTDRSSSFHSCVSGSGTATDLDTFREVEWRLGMRWEMVGGVGVEGLTEGEEEVGLDAGADEGEVGGWRAV